MHLDFVADSAGGQRTDAAEAITDEKHERQMLLGVILGEAAILKVLSDGKSTELIDADKLTLDGHRCHHREDEVWVCPDLLTESANNAREGLLLLFFLALQLAEGGDLLLSLLLDIDIFDAAKEE